MANNTTPRGITANVRRLCKHMKVDAQPVFVEVESRSDAESGECFSATDKQVRERGGECVYGWLIWEWPGILVEAEFHAMWRSPAGELVDVALKEDGEKRVLFLPDSSTKYQGVRIDNVRLPVGQNPAIRKFIKGKERFFEMFQKKYGNAVGYVKLDNEIALLHDELEALGQQLAVSREARRAQTIVSRKKVETR